MAKVGERLEARVQECVRHSIDVALEKHIANGVEKGIESTLIKLGFTVDKPIELQADMRHLRQMRLGCEAVKGNIIKTILGVTVPGTLYIIWRYLFPGNHS